MGTEKFMHIGLLEKKKGKRPKFIQNEAIDYIAFADVVGIVASRNAAKEIRFWHPKRTKERIMEHHYQLAFHKHFNRLLKEDND